MDRETKALIVSLVVVGCIGFGGLLIYIRYIWPPSEEEFARSVHLTFAATDRYDKTKTIFWLEFSSSGRTIWPGYSKLSLYVDGKETKIPTEWSPHVIRDHILPGAPRGAGWWMDFEEIKKWIGAGEHTLYFRFRNVPSNVLRVSVPEQGRILCDPEYNNPAWTKDK
jgi:hypothetical protein